MWIYQLDPKEIQINIFFSYFRGGWDLGQNMCVATGSVFKSFNLNSFRTRASVFKIITALLTIKT